MITVRYIQAKVGKNRWLQYLIYKYLYEWKFKVKKSWNRSAVRLLGIYGSHKSLRVTIFATWNPFNKSSQPPLLKSKLDFKCLYVSARIGVVSETADVHLSFS